MSMDEIRSIFTELIRFGLGSVIAGLVIFVFLKFWLQGYMTEKGRNLALKEDLGRITQIVEDVKLQNAELLESVKTKNQLRLAALDQRLRAHQEAYGLWREINGAVDTTRIDDVVARCDKWWGENNLYLEPEARAAFLAAFVGARDLDYYKSCFKTPDLVTKTRAAIDSAGAAIEHCIALPQLNEVGRAKKPV